MATATRAITVRMPKPKRRHGRRKMQISAAVVAGFAPSIATSYLAYKSNSNSLYMGFANFAKVMSGFDITKNGQWAFGNLFYGLVPVIGGVAIHKMANRLGLNRALASAGIPVIRI